MVVSYIGYVNHEVKATSAPMTIRIKEDTQNLEEVVVVGYGVQKKESLTGAMQVVSNEKLLDATSLRSRTYCLVRLRACRLLRVVVSRALPVRW